MFEITREQLQDIISTASVELVHKVAGNDPTLQVALVGFSGVLCSRIIDHLEGSAPLDAEELELSAKIRMKWEGLTS